MRFAIALMCAAAVASAQTAEAQLVNDLGRVLASLNGAALEQSAARLGAELARVPEGAHRPKSGSLPQFATQFVRSVGARTIPLARAARIAREMVFLLRSSGVGTWRVQEALDRVARELMASGVGEGEARVAMQGLRTLADQVRGPQDIMAEV